MEVKVNDTITEDYNKHLLQLLTEHNLEKAKDIASINKPLEIVLFDNDILTGGIYGRSLWGTLEINYLVVDARYRGRGLGSLLIQKAEAEAFNRGCKYISLNTFSFQAPDFYKKLGFELIGSEPDFPLGFEKFYFRKTL